jgi:hypothetical protein
VSSNIYPTKDSPNYYQGHGTVLAYLVVFLFTGSIVNTLLLRAENRKRIRGERDGWRTKSSQEMEVMGDKRFDSSVGLVFWKPQLTHTGPTSCTWSNLPSDSRRSNEVGGDVRFHGIEAKK